MNQAPEKNITINVTAGSITKGIIIICLFLMLFYVRDVVLIVLTAVVIASAIEPATKWFGKYRISRLPATVIVYVLMAFLFAGILYLLLPTLLNDFSSYLNNLPKYLKFAEAWMPAKNQTLIENSSVYQQLSQTSSTLSQSVNDLSNSFSNVSAGFIQGASYIFGGVLSFVIIIVLSFYLAVQEDGIANFLKIVTPARHERYVIGLWKRAQHKIGLWMQGQLLLGVTVGVLVFLVLTIFGIQHALLLAVLAALFELIPVFGPVLSAIPGVLIALAEKGAIYGIIIAGWYLIIQQFENHLFYPLVVRKIIGISPIVVIIALIVGAKLAGFLGIILSVPLSTTLIEYLNDWEKQKTLDLKA
jgi:predicted PurR-regulated permease PerM